MCSCAICRQQELARQTTNFRKNPAILRSSDGIRLVLDSCFFIRQTLRSFLTLESILNRGGISEWHLSWFCTDPT